MKVFHTTESLADLLGFTGTTARRRVDGGEWKPSAQTSSGKALFSEEAATQIVNNELRRKERKKGRKSGRSQLPADPINPE